MYRQVAVCGPAACTEAEASDAYRIGQLLAERGSVVLCGGGPGVMAAVAAGVQSRNGLVVGILPHDDRRDTPSDLGVAIVTNMGQARNAILVGSADAVIVVGGSWGTLSELALARRRGGIPVVSLHGWQVHDRHGRSATGIEHVETPEDAVEAVSRSSHREP